MLQVCIKYSTRDLIRDVTSRCHVVKMSVDDKVLIENR